MIYSQEISPLFSFASAPRLSLWEAKGRISMFLGRHEEAQEQFKKPRPRMTGMGMMGMALWGKMGRNEEIKWGDMIFRESRIGCIGWDGVPVPGFPPLVFLPKLLVKESSIFVPKFRAVSKDDQSARAVKPGPWCPWCQVGEDQPRTSGLRPCIHGRAHPEPLFGFLWQFPVVLLAKDLGKHRLQQEM